MQEVNFIADLLIYRKNCIRPPPPPPPSFGHKAFLRGGAPSFIHPSPVDSSQMISFVVIHPSLTDTFVCKSFSLELLRKKVMFWNPFGLELLTEHLKSTSSSYTLC